MPQTASLPDRPVVAALPLYASPFVGRGEQLGALREAVSAGARLVTIVGTAGVGKTRLAVEFVRAATTTASADHDPAEPLRPALVRASAFCDVTTARSHEAVCDAVTRALGIGATSAGSRPPGATSDMAARIGRWLAARGPMLLVLDNFEQVAAHAAETVGAWMAAAPEVVFVVTSRVPLAVPGERTVHVAPLTLPPVDAANSDAVLASEAAQLFLRCAGPAARGPLNARAVADVVRRLEGIPLAIELAAARLEVLSLDALRARLSARFALLRNPSVGPAARHGALWNAIDWSWQLLTARERAVAAQTAVFAGGFTREAAEAVVALPDELDAADQPRASMAAVLDALVRKSLLVADASAVPPRYRGYESVREYALVQLDAAGERAAVEARHTGYFLARGEAWAAAVEGLAGRAALDALAAEHDNLRAVCDRALASGAAQTALRAALALSPLLAARSAPAVHVALLDAALAAAARDPSVARTPAVARALNARSLANRFRGRIDPSYWDLARALAIATSAGDVPLVATVRAALASLCDVQGHHAAAREQFALALAAAGAGAPEGRDTDVAAVTRVHLGVSLVNQGQYDAAQAELLRGLTALRPVGYARVQELALAHLGVIHADRNELAPARACFEEALAIARELGLRRREAVDVSYLGILHHHGGEAGPAREAYGHALALFRELEDARFEAYYLTYLALLELEQGALDAAVSGFELALARLATVREPRFHGMAAGALAGARALLGDRAGAATLLAQSEAELLQYGNALVLSALEAPRGLLEIAAATAALDAGEPAEADAQIERARARDAALSREPSAWARLSRRALSAALVRFAERARAWTVARDGGWFAPPGGRAVSMARRPTLAPLLAALLRARLDQPGAALSTPALIAVGWPGERLVPQAGTNRARVAVSTLRKMGLDALLEHTREGYRLDPAHAVSATDAPPPSNADTAAADTTVEPV